MNYAKCSPRQPSPKIFPYIRDKNLSQKEEHILCWYIEIGVYVYLNHLQDIISEQDSNWHWSKPQQQANFPTPEFLGKYNFLLKKYIFVESLSMEWNHFCFCSYLGFSPPKYWNNSSNVIWSKTLCWEGGGGVALARKSVKCTCKGHNTGK